MTSSRTACGTTEPIGTIRPGTTTRLSIGRERPDGDGEVGAFVRATDFDRSFVVIAQTMMQSARWLALRTIERTDAGLRVLVVTESPDRPYGDDAAVHSLAIRITDERAVDPDDVVVEHEGHELESGATD